ncbi:Wound-induced basic protein [Platanthera guangdongensis]|uniref:Wound-induced basic protein n=1 Tax=Platanthera guangdongensis TaxID=2320717 RepID=A0ABR2MB43_9ASPA
MIYDVNSPLFRSFLSQKGGSSDKRTMATVLQSSWRYFSPKQQPIIVREMKSRSRKSKSPKQVRTSLSCLNDCSFLINNEAASECVLKLHEEDWADVKRKAKCVWEIDLSSNRACRFDEVSTIIGLINEVAEVTFARVKSAAAVFKILYLRGGLKHEHLDGGLDRG